MFITDYFLNPLQRNALRAAGLVVLYCFFKVLASYWRTGSKTAPFPPGPKPRFLVGNLWDLPKSAEAFNRYMQWERQYNSKILYASALGSHFVILNDLEDAEELLERRATIFSDRPNIPIIELNGWKAVNMSFMSLGDEWRSHRRIAQQNFRQAAAEQYYPIQLQKTHTMLQGLLDSPERFDYHNEMLSMSITMAVMYGHDLKSLDDPYIVAALENTEITFKMMQPGYTLINILPILKYIPTWFPGATSQRLAQRTKEQVEMLRTYPMQLARKKIKDGTALPSVISKYISTNDSEFKNAEDDVVGGLGFTVHIGSLLKSRMAASAGSDTTISATGTLFYLLATHPEVQVRAQKELDAVLGGSRLPDFDDRPSLPYIDAIYRELLRWRPPGLLGIPHCAHRDEIYKGYLIPKGTSVFPNIWAMTRDENLYPDPHSFKPERFIDSNGKLNTDKRIIAYGFGRRICVGRHLASNTMWITIASILAAFTISKAKDAQGNEIDIDDNFDDTGVITHKTPFKCLIAPRSERMKQLIRESSSISSI